ncbi:hypothetical protein GCM10018780_62700 [Streptomyces lanatus]|nr:hypothetical protein GCM10018780_62700 [Streptomyces lanatus]
MGVGVGAGRAMDDGFRRPQDVGDCQVSAAGEALDVGGHFGAEVAYGHGHGGARYVGDVRGCLSFSGGYGTIAL